MAVIKISVEIRFSDAKSNYITIATKPVFYSEIFSRFQEKILKYLFARVGLFAKLWEDLIDD